MKALRYLLMMVAVMGVLSASAQLPKYGTTYKPRNIAVCSNTQTTVLMPEATIGSTGSALMTTGSSLPQAAVTGTTTTYDHPGGPAKMRRDVGGGGTADDEDPDAPEEPFPLGDAALPLMLLALMYAVYKVRKRVCA